MDDEKLLILQNNIISTLSGRIDSLANEVRENQEANNKRFDNLEIEMKETRNEVRENQEANSKRFDKLEKEMKKARKEVRKLAKIQDEDFGVLENMIVEVDKKHDRQFQIVMDTIKDVDSKITDTQSNVAVLLNGTKEMLRSETKEVESKLRKEIAEVKRAI